MRVVIADDENLVRYSLKSMLPECLPTVTIVGEARNGEELVALVRRLRPDLAFVDIRMPKLDGLAAIERGKELSPNTHWVILTSYSEFDYAKQAVRLGVSDYLLKPVSPEELRAALERQRTSFDAEHAVKSDEFEGEVVALLNGTGPAARLDSRFADDTAFCAAVLIVIDAPYNQEGRTEQLSALSTSIRTMLGELATVERPAALVPLAGGDLCVVVAWSGAQAEAGSAAFKRLLNRLSQLSPPDERTRLTLVASEVRWSFESLAEEVRRLVSLKGLRALSKWGRVIGSQELLELAGESVARDLANHLERAVDAARSRRTFALLGALEGVEGLLRDSPSFASRRTRSSVAEFLANLLATDLTESEVVQRGTANPASEGLAWMQELKTRVEHLMLGGSGLQEDLITKARAYVDHRFDEELRITEVARLLHVTPNYLSSQFRKKVGTTFVRYLTERRIDRAKELLRIPGIQVQEVARSVGYRSTRHFTRIFRSHCGIYPSEYRAGRRPPAIDRPVQDEV